MLPVDASVIQDALIEFQREVQRTLIRSRNTSSELHKVSHTASADTIYTLDTHVEPVIEEFFHDFGKTMPLVLIAEGLHDDDGREGPVAFPRGASPEEAKIRIIIDPIDGTRGLMYDKRPAWSLAGVAPNRGENTRLRDIQLAVMTELPTSRMGFADTLTAIRGMGARGQGNDLRNGASLPLALAPSQAHTINHGFATISNFFPGTKVLAGQVMEHLARHLIGPADVTQATVFEDQYISTGGQFYELIVGHDRFNADLRPLFYKIQKQPEGLCCHPYDCATWLIAHEAGVLLTDGLGRELDGPLDTTTGLSWAAYANPTLRDEIEPLLTAYLKELGA
jgi:fructose-1,6-bisphosphatase/inositol monophosphatase family enzyme